MKNVTILDFSKLGYKQILSAEEEFTIIKIQSGSLVMAE